MAGEELYASMIAGIVTIVITGIVLTLNHKSTHNTNQNFRDNIADLYNKNTNLLTRVTTLETTVNIFTDTLKTHLVNSLHSPHTPEKDVLLEKLRDNQISKDEACELKEMTIQDLKEYDRRSPEYIASTLLLCLLESKIPTWNTSSK